MMERKILIVDDNAKLCESLARNFEDSGIQSLIAHDRAQAIRAFSKHAISTVLLDIVVGDDNGMDILTELRRLKPDVPIIMITGYATVETAVQSLKLGATDYVKKPLDFERLEKIVDNSIRLCNLTEENIRLKSHLSALRPSIVARSHLMIALMEQVHKLGPTDLPILIIGENGTGKELIADAIHLGSHRSTRKLIKINCAAFPETLLENELFGHERGSYTGADSSFKGVFEQADGGTLFLDEIGDMPLSIQAKILRALQNNEIRRIGGTETVGIDVRFIAATNHDLLDLISRGKFREDLYYRLNGAFLMVPPLRNRKEDIPQLANLFIEEYCAPNGIAVKGITEEVRKYLLKNDWPGNIRELRNAVNYACAVSSSDEIRIMDLPPTVLPGAHNESIELLNVREQSERNLIVKALQQSRFNKKAAAERLSMSRKTLYNKIARYGIDTEIGIEQE